MKAALIVMSILGCDDSGTVCQPVATVSEQWATIAACDQASEHILGRYHNVSRPVVVAVCQTAQADSADEAAADLVPEKPMTNEAGEPVPPPAAKADESGLGHRALALVRNVLPTRNGIVETLGKPVHFVFDSYSWVMKKIEK